MANDAGPASIKNRFTMAIILAIGGIVQLGVGSIICLAGGSGIDSASIRFFHLEITAKGIGGIVLVTSTVWAYLAYLIHPKGRENR